MSELDDIIAADGGYEFKADKPADAEMESACEVQAESSNQFTLRMRRTYLIDNHWAHRLIGSDLGNACDRIDRQAEQLKEAQSKCPTSRETSASWRRTCERLEEENLEQAEQLKAKKEQCAEDCIEDCAIVDENIALGKAVALLNSMILSGEQHSDTSRKIVEQALKGSD